jgi:hypothetical protein
MDQVMHNIDYLYPTQDDYPYRIQVLDGLWEIIHQQVWYNCVELVDDDIQSVQYDIDNSLGER